MNIGLIVFAGKGTRMNSPIPKQFIEVNGKELVVYTIEVFQHSSLIDEIILNSLFNFLKSDLYFHRYRTNEFKIKSIKWS